MAKVEVKAVPVKGGGCIVSRVNYPVTLGTGLNSMILPPKGRLTVGSLAGLSTTDTRFILIPEETGGKV